MVVGGVYVTHPPTLTRSPLTQTLDVGAPPAAVAWYGEHLLVAHQHGGYAVVNEATGEVTDMAAEMRASNPVMKIMPGDLVLVAANDNIRPQAPPQPPAPPYCSSIP